MTAKRSRVWFERKSIEFLAVIEIAIINFANESPTTCASTRRCRCKPFYDGPSNAMQLLSSHHCGQTGFSLALPLPTLTSALTFDISFQRMLTRRRQQRARGCASVSKGKSSIAIEMSHLIGDSQVKLLVRLVVRPGMLAGGERCAQIGNS